MKSFTFCSSICSSVAMSAAFLLGFSACAQNDDIPQDGYYTFVGQTVEQYLAEEADFSLFHDFLKHSSLNLKGDRAVSSIAAMLSSYGYYTCFAPDNEAMQKYLNQLAGGNCNERKDLERFFEPHQVDSIVDIVAQMHVVSSSRNQMTYPSKDFKAKLSDMNLYDKVIYVDAPNTSYRINEQAYITERDIKCHNGYVHRINTVLEPVDRTLEDFFAEYPQFSIFAKAFAETKLEERMNTIAIDHDYVQDDGDYSAYLPSWDAYIETPRTRKLAFTMFLETDDVFKEAIPELAIPGADTLALLKAYALAWWEREYIDQPELLERGKTTIVTDADNYFNRFVAYHIVNKKIDRADFTVFWRYRVGMPPNYNRMREWTETLAPNTTLYLSSGSMGHAWPGGVDPDPDMLQLNPSPDNEVIYNIAQGWGRPSKDGVILADSMIMTENGFIHPVKSILTFPRAEAKRVRYRHDLSSIFPEVMSNNWRYQNVNMARVVFPEGYLSNITFLSKGTVFVLVQPNINEPNGAGRNGYLGDEWMAYNTYDFVMRLPAVPAGTYEVRMGYSRAGTRGCAQFYIGTSLDNLYPTGIPIDLTQTVLQHGWKSDSGLSQEEIEENDKEMRANGFMKGPNSWLCNNGGSGNSLRETSNNGGGDSPQRCVLGIITLQEDGPIYLRARNATSNPNVELMMDYFEICPSNIYDNPFRTEPKD